MSTRSIVLTSIGLCLSLIGCSDIRHAVAERSAEAVSSARQCGAQEIAPNLLMRLSTYSSDGIPGDTIQLVELCHPERGCNATASYQNGMAPLVVSRDPELVIEIPMATDLRVFRNETWIEGRRVPVRIEAKRIRTDEEANAARRAHGLPPGRVSFDNCRSDLEIRPFYRNVRSLPRDLPSDPG